MFFEHPIIQINVEQIKLNYFSLKMVKVIYANIIIIICLQVFIFSSAKVNKSDSSTNTHDKVSIEQKDKQRRSSQESESQEVIEEEEAHTDYSMCVIRVLAKKNHF
jgi:hypothetical protein